MYWVQFPDAALMGVSSNRRTHPFEGYNSGANPDTLTTYKMAYYIYKSIVSKEDYFKSWDISKRDSINESIEDAVYHRYTIKAKVMQRANFKCQNTTCKHGEPLTWHHVKFQKNDGKDSERNTVILCKHCHDAFHQAKIAIVYPKKGVPKHIAGHTYRLEAPDGVSAKVLRKKMRAFRRSLRGSYNLEVSDSEFYWIFKYLFS